MMYKFTTKHTKQFTMLLLFKTLMLMFICFEHSHCFFSVSRTFVTFLFSLPLQYNAKHKFDVDLNQYLINLNLQPKMSRIMEGYGYACIFV